MFLLNFSFHKFSKARLLIIFSYCNQYLIYYIKKECLSLYLILSSWRGKFFKELGVLSDGIVLGNSLLPPKDYKPTFQAKLNTKKLHGIDWNSGKLEYIELSSIIQQHSSPTTKYFVKG